MTAPIVNGNALHIPLADKSVQCVVASPPYWGLRDYGTARWIGGDAECDHISRRPSLSSGLRNDGREHKGLYEGEKALVLGAPYRDICPKCGAVRQDAQLGLEATPEEYVANMVAVFREVWRVLRDDGTVWLNLGDSYANNPSTTQIPRNNQGNGTGIFRIPDEKHIQARRQKANRLTDMKSDGLKHKDLVGIPWRVAFALQADGWYLRSDIIWSKPNPMPESVTDRPTKAHEYLFLLSKKSKYYYDADAVRESYPQSTIERMKYPVAKVSGSMNGAWSTKTTDERVIVDGNPAGRNRRTVWTIATQAYCGVVSYGKCRIASQDCQVHDYQEAQEIALDYDEQQDVFSWLHNLDKHTGLVRGQEGAAVAIPLYRHASLSDGFSAIPRNMRMNKTEDELERDVIFYGISSSDTEYIRLLRRSASRFFHKNGSNTWVDASQDGLGFDLSKEIIYRIVGIATFEPPIKNCTCHYIGKVEKRQDHFAVFPEDLVTPCILAGTSERGCCPVCGAGWKRVVEKKQTEDMRWSDNGGRARANVPGQETSETSVFRTGKWSVSETLGWQPACTHDAAPIPCTVFDPFSGTATVGVVAQRHGRKFIGLELSLEYIRLAKERLLKANGYHVGRLI